MAGPGTVRLVERTHRNSGRRELVIRTALEVVAERGLSETRISDVAERAGMSKSHVLYYVGSRAAMFRETLRWVERELAEQTAAAIDGTEDPLERLRRTLELASATGPDDARWMLWLEAWERSPRDPEVAELQRTLAGDWIELLARELRNGQERGAFRDFSPGELARHLSTLIDGLAIQVISGTGMSHERMLELLWAEVDARILAHN